VPRLTVRDASAAGVGERVVAGTTVHRVVADVGAAVDGVVAVATREGCVDPTWPLIVTAEAKALPVVGVPAPAPETVSPPSPAFTRNVSVSLTRCHCSPWRRN
jgi:hypothetical protein